MDNLYCDLLINGVPIWYGVPCLNNVFIDSFPYLGFMGHLVFNDYQGSTDPQYTGIGPGGRYVLLYYQSASVPVVQVPLLAVPSQQLDITLGGQYCTISIYDATVAQLVSTL